MIATAEHLWKHDRAIFERLKDDVARPPFVLGLRFEEAWDSLDEPAAWIWVKIDESAKLTDTQINNLNYFIDLFRDRLLFSGFMTRPIARIESEVVDLNGRERVDSH